MRHWNGWHREQQRKNTEREREGEQMVLNQCTMSSPNRDYYRSSAISALINYLLFLFLFLSHFLFPNCTPFNANLIILFNSPRLNHNWTVYHLPLLPLPFLLSLYWSSTYLLIELNFITPLRRSAHFRLQFSSPSAFFHSLLSFRAQLP